MTSEVEGRDSPVDEVIDCARAVKTAIHQLCRASRSRPRMTPADVSAVLADLAAATAALPQVAGQLGDILKRATDDYLLKMDATVDGGKPAGPSRKPGSISARSAVQLSTSTGSSARPTTRLPTSPQSTGQRDSDGERRMTPRASGDRRNGDRHLRVRVEPGPLLRGDGRTTVQRCAPTALRSAQSGGFESGCCRR